MCLDMLTSGGEAFTGQVRISLFEAVHPCFSVQEQCEEYTAFIGKASPRQLHETQITPATYTVYFQTIIDSSLTQGVSTNVANQEVHGKLKTV